ncbi:hypothetical protein ACFL0Y_02515 [Patescibacteria group bacterium]
MAKEGQSTPEEAWAKISTPEVRAKIVSGTIQTAISMELTPDQASELFANLDSATADSIAYLFSGVADGQVVRDPGRSLGGK